MCSCIERNRFSYHLVLIKIGMLPVACHDVRGSSGRTRDDLRQCSAFGTQSRHGCAAGRRRHCSRLRLRMSQSGRPRGSVVASPASEVGAVARAANVQKWIWRHNGEQGARNKAGEAGDRGRKPKYQPLAAANCVVVVEKASKLLSMMLRPRSSRC